VKILDAGDVIPRPSLIVSSGNGLAAYLLLDKPMQLNPDEYRAVVGGIAATLKQAGFDILIQRSSTRRASCATHSDGL